MSCKYVLLRVDGVPINTGTIAMNYVHKCSEIERGRNHQVDTKKAAKTRRLAKGKAKRERVELCTDKYDKSECVVVGAENTNRKH